MADTQFVSKSQLIALIREVVGEGKTGLISVLTDTQHAVLLKFSEGKLIHAYSRSRDIGDVIQVINECNFVKFSFASIPMENKPEIMAIVTFIQLLESGNSYDAPDDTSITIPNAAGSSAPAGGIATAPLKVLLVSIASEYVGPIAEMIVDEAFENHSETAKVIEYIAEMIPDAKQAADFRTTARSNKSLFSI